MHKTTQYLKLYYKSYVQKQHMHNGNMRGLLTYRVLMEQQKLKVQCLMLMGTENQTIGLAFAYCILYQKQKTFVVEYFAYLQWKVAATFILFTRMPWPLPLAASFQVYANTHTRTEDRNQYVPAAKARPYSKSALQRRSTVVVRIYCPSVI